MGFLEKFFVGAAVAVAVAGVSGVASARDVVSFDPAYSAGTIVVKTGERKLYYVLGGGRAIRYGVGVGRPGFTWSAMRTGSADAVIVSPGAQSLMLGLEAEKRLLGHGLSTCATCDGFFFREHEIAVVGGGDSAVEEATFLTRFARSVTLIHRRGELRASQRFAVHQHATGGV